VRHVVQLEAGEERVQLGFAFGARAQAEETIEGLRVLFVQRLQVVLRVLVGVNHLVNHHLVAQALARVVVEDDGDRIVARCVEREHAIERIREGLHRVVALGHETHERLARPVLPFELELFRGGWLSLLRDLVERCEANLGIDHVAIPTARNRHRDRLDAPRIRDVADRVVARAVVVAAADQRERGDDCLRGPPASHRHST